MRSGMIVDRRLQKLLGDYAGESRETKYSQEELLNGRKPAGFWQDEDNALAVARAIKRKHHCQRLPNVDQLLEMGYSTLVAAMDKYYGGMRSFRKLLGEKVKEVRARGEHRSIGEIKRDLREVDFQSLALNVH